MTKLILIAAIIVFAGAGAYFLLQAAERVEDNGAGAEGEEAGFTQRLERAIGVEDATDEEEGAARSPSPEPRADRTIEGAGATTHVVVYAENGYSPKEILVKKGDTVRFANEGSRSMWPASDFHPSHTVYDGTSRSEHCASPTGTTFDACANVPPGEAWSFTFTKPGSWKYHDHSRASFTGTIIVEE